VTPSRFAPLLLALALCLAGTASAAPEKPDADDPCAIPPAVRDGPPIEAGTPIKIAVGIALVDLAEINDIDQTFRADAVVSLHWNDPRLSVKARGGALTGCRLGLKDIWNPDIRPLNVRTQHRMLGESLRIDADGAVDYERQVLASFSSRFALRDFPFDIQTLRMRMASFNYGPELVRFVPHKFDEIEGRELSIAGWKVLDDHPDASVKPMKVGYEQFTRLDHVILVARKPDYFLWNFVLPLGLIVLMAWSVFWLDPKAWGPQIGIATASAFTLVAFLIALRSRLPPVPYLTRLDELILYSTILVFAALAQVIVTSRLAESDRLELARRLDAYGRWIFIGVFGIVIYTTLAR
jgi:hypothetical protein